MIRKAVIPAAGLGTRFLPATKAQPKEMLPVVDKPVIQYVVEEAIASGIKDILIITGKGKRAIEDHFDKSKMENEFLDEIDEMMNYVNLLYTRQREPRGLGDAVYYAKSFVGDEAFALLLGDTITIPECTKELIKKYDEFKTSIIAVEEVPKEKISSYGIIKGKEVEGDIHLVEDLVEKPSPEEAPSNLGILGRYVLTPAIFGAIERTPPGKGNEIQLTDAVRLVKEKIYAYVYRGKRYDIGNKIDWIKSNIELFIRDERFNNEFEIFLRAMMKDEQRD
ncbi:UTP--glucose-1-phosphate uridylyltransferase AglF [ANME-1 cluster archaeon GoMg3.2]|nr:UTP--glucose-1-phosphate uridylyltransferase AglF [ANME-1 cluster archaeon GoMg3.2]